MEFVADKYKELHFLGDDEDCYLIEKVLESQQNIQRPYQCLGASRADERHPASGYFA